MKMCDRPKRKTWMVTHRFSRQDPTAVCQWQKDLYAEHIGQPDTTADIQSTATRILHLARVLHYLDQVGFSERDRERERECVWDIKGSLSLSA